MTGHVPLSEQVLRVLEMKRENNPAWVEVPQDVLTALLAEVRRNREAAKCLAPPAVAAPKLESELYIAAVNKLKAEVAALKERLENVAGWLDATDVAPESKLREHIARIAALARETTTENHNPKGDRR